MTKLSLAVEAAARALIKVLLVCAAGYAAALFPRQHPVLQKRALKCLSDLTFHVFMPALIFSSVGNSLSTGLVANVWPMLVWGLVHMGISLLVAAITVRCISYPRSLERGFLVTLAFNNVVALPLLLMESITSEVDYFAADGKSKENYELASTYLFVFSLPWQFLFWGFAYPYLATDSTQTVEYSCTRTRTHRAPRTPQHNSAVRRSGHPSVVRRSQSMGAAVMDAPVLSIISPLSSPSGVESGQLDVTDVRSLSVSRVANSSVGGVAVVSAPATTPARSIGQNTTRSAGAVEMSSRRRRRRQNKQGQRHTMMVNAASMPLTLDAVTSSVTTGQIPARVLEMLRAGQVEEEIIEPDSSEGEAEAEAEAEEEKGESKDTDDSKDKDKDMGKVKADDDGLRTARVASNVSTSGSSTSTTGSEDDVHDAEAEEEKKNPESNGQSVGSRVDSRVGVSPAPTAARRRRSFSKGAADIQRISKMLASPSALSRRSPSKHAVFPSVPRRMNAFQLDMQVSAGAAGSGPDGRVKQPTQIEQVQREQGPRSIGATSSGMPESDDTFDSIRKRILHVCERLSTPSMAALLLGAFVGLIHPIRHFLFEGAFRTVGSTAKTLGQPAALASSLVMAAWLAHARDNRTKDPDVADSLPRSVLISAIVVKLLVLPLIGILLFLLLDNSTELQMLLPEQHLARLILLTEFVVPPGLTIIITVSQLRYIQQTLVLSHLYQYLYLASVISMSVVLTVGLMMIDVS